MLILALFVFAQCSDGDEYAAPESAGTETSSPSHSTSPSPTATPKLPKLTCKNVARENDKAIDAHGKWAEDFWHKRLDKIHTKIDKCAPKPKPRPKPKETDDDISDQPDDDDDDVDVPDWLCPTRFC